MLNLERLRSLHAIATYGSIAAAAEALHLTGSAVSQQMARLEREVGLPLLERHGRGVRLTDAGEVLVGHARDILGQVESAEADLAARDRVVSGRLAIAAFATAARGLLPTVISALTGDHPGLRVTLSEQEPPETLRLVTGGEFDIGVVQDWANAPLSVPDDLDQAMLLHDAADVALPIDHPLASRDVLALDELTGEDWIGWMPGQVCQDWLVQTMRGLGVEPRITHTVAEHPTHLALVAEGLGVALIPRLGRGPLSHGVRFVPLAPTLERHVFAVWRRSAGRRPAVVAGLAALRTEAVRVET